MGPVPILFVMALVASIPLRVGRPQEQATRHALNHRGFVLLTGLDAALDHLVDWFVRVCVLLVFCGMMGA